MYSLAKNIVTITALAIFLTACLDYSGFWGNDNWYGWQTTILSVEINPEPVTAGDSIAFRCVIKDSLDAHFHFQWTIAIADSTFDTDTEEHIFHR